jgi:carbon monoxide dehydrogenase subunit G
MKGRGKAPGSAVDLNGDMRLTEVDAEHTRMDWTAHVVVSGTIASVGARLLQGVAERLTGQFFDCLRSKLEAAEVDTAATTGGK